MRILIAYRYFHPDTPPYATMLREMSRWLVEAGHDVTIVTAQPSYKPEAGIPRQPWSETRGGVSIRRLPLLAEGGRGLRRRVNSFAFVLMAAVALAFARRPDLIWTASMPPVLQGALLRWIAALRGAKFLYHVQDIYPEIAVASGMMPDGRSFADSVEFKRLLIQDRERFVQAFVEHLSTYALRRVLTVDDRQGVQAIVDEALENQYGVKDIVRAVARSELIRKR